MKEESIRTGERGGYIRIDANSESPTTLTHKEITSIVQGQLKNKVQKGSDFIETVEVLYRDTSDKSKQILIKVQDGTVVIPSAGDQ